jgi:hypothetical protein
MLGGKLGFLADQLADPEASWSLGAFGVIAEFTRDADEATTLDRDDGMISAVTTLGGIRIETHSRLRPIASESPTPESWSHRVALCLPQETCAMNRRTVLTEVGLDRNALRAEDRKTILFDLGLGALQVDACVRSGDPAVIAALRSCAGKSLFAPGNTAMGVILASNPAPYLCEPPWTHRGFPTDPAGGRQEPDGPAHPRPPQAAGAWSHPRGYRAIAGRLDSLRPFLPAASRSGQVRSGPTLPA